MTTPQEIFEVTVFTVMGAWLLGSAAYALPGRGLRRWLRRWNAGLWFANWTVFGAGTRRAEIERYTLRFRDTCDGRMGDWEFALRGRRWVWHACLWQPERRLADRIQRMGRDISHALDHPEGERRIIAPHRALIARYLDVNRPRSRGVAREAQLIEEYAIVDVRADAAAASTVTERVILEFTEPPA